MIKININEHAKNESAGIGMVQVPLSLGLVVEDKPTELSPTVECHTVSLLC